MHDPSSAFRTGAQAGSTPAFGSHDSPISIITYTTTAYDDRNNKVDQAQKVLFGLIGKFPGVHSVFKEGRFCFPGQGTSLSLFYLERCFLRA